MTPDAVTLELKTFAATKLPSIPESEGRALLLKESAHEVHQAALELIQDGVLPASGKHDDLAAVVNYLKAHAHHVGDFENAIARQRKERHDTTQLVLDTLRLMPTKLSLGLKQISFSLGGREQGLSRTAGIAGLRVGRGNIDV